MQCRFLASAVSRLSRQTRSFSHAVGAQPFGAARAPLRVGIIGAGRIGRVHAETLAVGTPLAKPVIIADVNLKSAEALAAEFGIPHASASAADVFNHPEVEAVWICSPVATQSPHIVSAAAANKHVFCEKPMGTTVPQIEAAVMAAENAGTKLMIGFNRRFDRNYMRARHAVVTGEVGDVHVLRITSRDPSPPPVEYVKQSGGIFMDMAIHDFDMARFLTGSEVVSVYAEGACLVDPRIALAGDIDTAVITLKFANGAVGTIDISRKAVYGYDQRVEVFGSKGAVSTANEYPNQATLSTATAIQRDLPLNFFMDRYMDAYRRETVEFVRAVRNDTAPATSGWDGRQALLIALAAKQSLDSGKPVLVSEVEGRVSTMPPRVQVPVDRVVISN